MKGMIGGLVMAATAGAIALASPAQADEAVFACPDGFTGVAEGQTSCPFAHNVGVADHLYGPGVVTAYSPVTGQDYTMQCGGGFAIRLTSGRTLVADRCVGGNNAVVWVW